MNSTPADKPVFYSQSSSRWKRFIWLVKIIAIILLVAIASILVSLFHKQVFRLPTLREHIVLSQKESAKFKSKDIELAEVKHFMELAKVARTHKGHDFYKKDKILPGEIRKYKPVRAGFYVNWDIQSKYSLIQNAAKINMVIPEWLFVQDSTGKITVDIDNPALEIMRKNHMAIIPMLSNNFNNFWSGKNIHQIITSPVSRSRLINNLITILDQYKFNGVNIDFEELTETTDAYMIAFQKEMYEKLHAKGYLVTQDIVPFNDDYNAVELAKCNDFLFLMGYDQHNSTTEAGPVAAQFGWKQPWTNYVKKYLRIR